MLRDLIFAFDDDEGVSSAVYLAVVKLVEKVMGMKAAKELDKYMDATEERFYFKTHPGDVWGAMVSTQLGIGKRKKPKPK